MGVEINNNSRKIIAELLLIAVGFCTFVQYLANYKPDDSPAQIIFTPTFTISSSGYAGTASGTTTTTL